MKDDRVVPRNRTFLPANVEIEELGISARCTIRDLSDLGARLQLSDSVSLPSSFRLYIPKFDRTVVAELRWRRGDFVGVQFGSIAAQAPEPAPERSGAQYVKKLENEIAKLKLIVASIKEDPARALAILERDAA